MDNIIYLDNNSSTPMDPRVLAEMMPYLTDKYGNAAIPHKLGKYLDIAVEKSRRKIADLIDTNAEEIFFTAGATEAINMGLRGLVGPGKHHIITVETEHPAVLETCMYLEARGNAVTYLSVDSDGLIDYEELERAFTPRTKLIGSKKHRIYTTSTIRFDGIDSEYIVQKLDDICVSNCSVLRYFEAAPSPVLQAMGLSKDEASNALRFSLGRFTTAKEIGQTVEAVGEIIKQLHNNKSLHRN